MIFEDGGDFFVLVLVDKEDDEKYYHERLARLKEKFRKQKRSLP